MTPVKDFPIVGLALLTFSAHLTLSRIGEGEDAYLELNWDWSAIVWDGAGTWWKSVKE